MVVFCLVTVRRSCEHQRNITVRNGLEFLLKFCILAFQDQFLGFELT